MEERAPQARLSLWRPRPMMTTALFGRLPKRPGNMDNDDPWNSVSCPSVSSSVCSFIQWLWSALRGKARLALQHDVVFLFFLLLSFPSVTLSGVVLGREMKTLEMRNAIRR